MAAPTVIAPEVVQIPEIPLEGGKKCKTGQRRSRVTGRCRKICSTRDSETKELMERISDLEDELNQERRFKIGGNYETTQEDIDAANAGGVQYTGQIGPVRPNGMFGGAKRKLSKYNKFVKEFHKKHRSMKGTSFIRAAAKAWRSRSRSGKSKSRSASRRR
jgi:hypothetical protein